MFMQAIRNHFASHEGIDYRKVIFFALVIFGGSIFWLSPHLPMTDLPQHEGQVSLMHDLWSGQSKWKNLLSFNYFTPYVLGYCLVLPLTFLVSVAASFKIALTLGFFGFVYSCILLRKHFGGDARLDILFIPGYFGLTYSWGQFPFLLAVPFGILFIILSDRYAKSPSLKGGIMLAFSSVFLFFSHGLIFLFANTIGAIFILINNDRFAKKLNSAWPYLISLILILVYRYLEYTSQLEFSDHYVGYDTQWWEHWRERLFFPLYSLISFAPTTRSLHSNEAVFLIGVILLLSPAFLKSRLNKHNTSVFVPISVLIFIWLLVPESFDRGSFIFQRFSIFLLPFFAIIFASPAEKTKSGGSGILAIIKPNHWQLILALACCAYLSIQAERVVGFARESSDFDEILNAVDPNQRALSIILDRRSTAANNIAAYLHYPLWYQSEKHGLVDYNVAAVYNMIIRYNREDMPHLYPGFEWSPQQFNWEKNQGWIYRYFFMRKSKSNSFPEFIHQNGQCQVSLLKSQGTWAVYENHGCNAN